MQLEIEGHPSPPGDARIVINEDKFVSLSMGSEYEGTISVDASQNPKQLEMAFTEGPHRGQKSLGIYELDGDTWRICLGFAGVARPREFVTRPGSGHAFEILKREIVAPAPP